MSAVEVRQDRRWRVIGFLALVGIVLIALTILVLTSDPSEFLIVIAYTLGGVAFGLFIGRLMVRKDAEGVEHRLVGEERREAIWYSVITFTVAGYLIGLVGALVTP